MRYATPLWLLIGLAVPHQARALRRLQQQTTVDSVHSAPRKLDAVRVRATRAPLGYTAVSAGTATRTNLPLLDTPRSATVITSALIADQSMQSMADVFHYVPGVSLQSGEGHRDTPIIRGNSSSADFFVDGMRDDGQYLRDLYNVESVEVLKGSEALLFGRGGGGGIVNRVTRQAGWAASRSLTVEGGSFDHRRAVADVGGGLSRQVAARLTAVAEHSGGFRDAAELRRYGINPTIAVLAGNTTMHLGFESFDDARRADRGIPSFRGRPVNTDLTTFFGNPAVNHARSQINRASADIQHQTASGWTFRNRTEWAYDDIFYRNTYPGAVNSTGTQVTLAAYEHAIPRRNLLNTTDARATFATGRVNHLVVAGVDLFRQHSGNVRRTGYYGDTASAYLVPIASPNVDEPVAFRMSATDADNTTLARDAAVYLQDQVALSAAWIVIAGARYERFDLAYHDNRNASDLQRTDHMLTPRLGIVYKPAKSASLYGSYGVSFLPASGDQFSRLTVTSATLEPERFTNQEIGAKWKLLDQLELTAAIYRLDRTNTSSPDPTHTGLTVQTGSQRTTGWEAQAAGRMQPWWQVVAGVSGQHARIVSTTTSAPAGASVPLVPSTTLSVWNRFQPARRLGVGVGVISQTAMYAAVDNTVTLPGYTRVDAAVFASIRPGVRAQINVENLLNRRYFPTTQGNNNIMPGAPRMLRVAVTLTDAETPR
jgi:catecholate siderophore receptor